MGLFTILLTDNYKQLMQRDEYSEVNFIQYCDLSDIERVKEIIDYLGHEDLNILAIVSFIDPYCAMAAELSAIYNRPTFTYLAMAKMQNKLESRLCLKGTNLIPKFEIITKDLTIDLEYVKRMLPVVVKYIDSNGSKDVYLCDTLSTYHKYTQKLFEKYPEGQILIEEYMDGTQYIVEAVVKDKVVKVVGIIEQEIEFINEHFIITASTIY